MTPKSSIPGGYGLLCLRTAEVLEGYLKTGRISRDSRTLLLDASGIFQQVLRAHQALGRSVPTMNLDEPTPAAVSALEEWALPAVVCYRKEFKLGNQWKT